jgi:uncharacterized protein with ATP-grasp and redox domains
MAKIHSQCVTCILNKYLKKFPENTPENVKLDYMKGVLGIIASCDSETSPPEIVASITEHKNNLFGFSDDYSGVKEMFNDLMLKNEPFYSDKIKSSAENFKTALKFAMLGNYIDFGALDSVDQDKLLEIPDTAETLDINETEYNNFLSDLKSAKNLVYLTDNCGEIVMDKLFIQEIKTAFPQLKITVIVKGNPVLNDATMEDAKFVGLDKLTTVIHNGCNIAGTPLNKISNDAKEIIDGADVIISKGQANFETLSGCEKNIYYLFLCKCSLYCDRFNVPQFTGLLLNEKRLNVK